MFEPRHLAALDAVVSEGTFARAAVRLNYSQSTLSQQIAALERAVGGAVFDRPPGPRRPELTPLGRLVLDVAREHLDRSARAVEAIERFRAGEDRVDVGTFQTVTTEILPGVVRRLRADRPGCEIRLFEDEVEEPRLDGLDVLFFDRPGPDDLDRVLVVEDEHVVVARRDDAGLPDGPVALEHLDGRSMVGFPTICDQRLVETAYAQAGVRPRFVFRTADNHGVVAMVRAGLGIAVLPRLSIGSVPDELVLRPIEPALPPRPIYALSRGTLSPLARAVIEAAVETGEQLTREGRCRLTPASR